METGPTTPDELLDPSGRPSNAPCLIVHSNVLVAEDLREILMNAGAQSVVVYGDFADITEDNAALVFASGGLERTLRAPHFDAWAHNGTSVVLLDDGDRAQDASKYGLHLLNEPFRTEDVVALLTDLQIF